MRFEELGELQLSILAVLWQAGPSSVRDVVTALSQDRTVAYTTALTVLRTLERRGLVAHQCENGSRMFRYSALITRDDVRNELLGDLIEKLFDGSPTLLFQHMLQQGWLHDSASDLE
jgi:predicted transcriptional regulator